jgi:hypothetical protein
MDNYIVTNSPSGDHTLATKRMLQVLSGLIVDKQSNLNSDWLHTEIRKKEQPLVLDSFSVSVSYVGQPEGKGTEHYWRIHTDDESRKVLLDNYVKSQLSRSFISAQFFSFNLANPEQYKAFLSVLNPSIP